MGWIIALLILFALAWLPLGVSAAYDGDGPRVCVIAGPVKLPVYPVKKKDRPPKEKKQKPEPEKKTGSGQPKEKKKGGPISDFYPFVRLVLDFLLDFKRKLRVDCLELKLILAGGDPADLAIHYGKAWAALGNLWARLESWLVIKKRDVEVECDFVGSQTTVTARLDVTMTLGRLLALACRYGVRAVKEYLKFRKKRNGGSLT